MATQPFLFPLVHALRPTDPHVPAADRPRLTGQNAKLLEMLRQGPVTNVQMMHQGMAKYTSRISDLPKAGYKITAQHAGGGLYVYTLEQ